MNYTKTNHRNPQDEGRRHGTTVHLSRILLFLRANKGKSFTISEIKDACCMNGRCALNAINFLFKEGFIAKSKRKYKGRTTYDVNVYSVNIK